MAKNRKRSWLSFYIHRYLQIQITSNRLHQGCFRIICGDDAAVWPHVAHSKVDSKHILEQHSQWSDNACDNPLFALLQQKCQKEDKVWWICLVFSLDACSVFGWPFRLYYMSEEFSLYSNDDLIHSWKILHKFCDKFLFPSSELNFSFASEIDMLFWSHFNCESVQLVDPLYSVICSRNFNSFESHLCIFRSLWSYCVLVHSIDFEYSSTWNNLGVEAIGLPGIRRMSKWMRRLIIK